MMTMMMMTLTSNRNNLQLLSDHPAAHKGEPQRPPSPTHCGKLFPTMSSKLMKIEDCESFHCESHSESLKLSRVQVEKVGGMGAVGPRFRRTPSRQQTPSNFVHKA
jgi:hypothetical protein